MIKLYPNNDFRNYISNSSDHLEHHGILGQKWGVRRYQNPDGTLTPEGKLKLKTYKEKEISKVQNRIDKTKAKIIKSGPEDIRYDLRKNVIKISKKEIESLKKMKYSDMEKEKIYIGEKRLATALAAAGWTALNWSAWNAPGAIAGLLAMPSDKTIKTAYRLGQISRRKKIKQRTIDINSMKKVGD